jgi:subtilase family serine protease
MAVAAALLVFVFAMCGLAQESEPGSPRGVTESVQIAPPHVPSAPGTLIIPKSSQPQKPPAGHKFAAHTNVEVFIPNGLKPGELPPFTGYGYETPASLACHYDFVAGGSATAACNPTTTTTAPTGGSQSIAIVDAYDDPSAAGDLAWFSLQFGVPLSLSDFQVVWANSYMSSCYFSGVVPVDYTGGWEVEEALDIEWAHAMAPSAKIYLVEACSNYDTDLEQAILVATNLVQCGKTEMTSSGVGTCPSVTGKGEISMSWGGGEWSGETSYDSYFSKTNVVYFASSGDSPGVIWPCTSPNVVCAGGTTIRRNPSTFNFIQETPWVLGGGGQSMVEKIPSYQTTYISTYCKTYRCVPDLSFDADPYTGVYVYDTFPVESGYYEEWPEWIVVGGTSLSSPALAGIVNRAGSFAASSSAELTTIYKNMATTADFTDIATGYCGWYMGFSGVKGYDFCTGVGVVNTYAGK